MRSEAGLGELGFGALNAPSLLSFFSMPVIASCGIATPFAVVGAVESRGVVAGDELLGDEFEDIEREVEMAARGKV